MNAIEATVTVELPSGERRDVRTTGWREPGSTKTTYPILSEQVGEPYELIAINGKPLFRDKTARKVFLTDPERLPN